MVISFRPNPRIRELLERLVRETGKTKSALLSEGVERVAREHRTSAKSARPYDALKHLIGCVNDLPADLSSNPRKYMAKHLAAKRARNAPR